MSLEELKIMLDIFFNVKAHGGVVSTDKVSIAEDILDRHARSHGFSNALDAGIALNGYG